MCAHIVHTAQVLAQLLHEPRDLCSESITRVKGQIVHLAFFLCVLRRGSTLNPHTPAAHPLLRCVIAAEWAVQRAFNHGKVTIALFIGIDIRINLSCVYLNAGLPADFVQ